MRRSLLEGAKLPDGTDARPRRSSLLGAQTPRRKSLLAQEGEVFSSPATWGEVFDVAGKIASSAFTPRIPGLTTDERGLPLTPTGEPVISGPRDERAYWSTVAPTTAVAASLVGGSTLGVSGLVAREALGLTTGAVTRASIAKGRGEDPYAAALDPSQLAIDAGLSAIPELWAGAKALGRHAPSAIREPVVRGAKAVGRGITSTTDNVLTRIAKRYPRYGETLIDESRGPVTLSRAYDRPPIDVDLAAAATRPTPGMAPPAGRTALEGLKEGTWQHASRDLIGDQDPIVDAAGRLVARAAKLDRTVEELAGSSLDDALRGVAPGAESAAIVDLLEQGIDVNAPRALAAKARPVRSLLREIDELRRTKGVWDEVPTQARALDLVDQGVPVQVVGQGRRFAPAQRTSFYFPQRRSPGADTGRTLSAIERVMADNPELSAKAAQRRLSGTASGRTTGRARRGVMQDYSRSVHDVLPRYVEDETRRITNAAVFGGKPMRVNIDGTDMLVGEKAGTIYNHMLNTGQHQKARVFGNAILERYAPRTSYEGGIARATARGTSNMALSHVALTQTGQVHTPVWASGGPRQVARGYAMVKQNPRLKQLYEAGPQRQSFTDYLALGRGEPGLAPRGDGLPGPMELTAGIERWLRGPDSYAAVAMIDDLAQEAKGAVDAGQPFSGALVKRAAEAGTTPAALADEIARNGVLSNETWLNSIQSLVDRWQYQTGPGEIGHYLRTPAGALLAQYRAYGIKASQHVLDDIIRPLQSSDPSLKALGWQRARDFMLYGPTSNAATSAVKAVGRGRAPSVRSMLESAVSGPTGIVGDAAATGVETVTQDYGDRPAERFLSVPALSVPAQAVDMVGRGVSGGDPLLTAQGALKLGGLLDPRIPLYGSAPLGLTREATR